MHAWQTTQRAHGPAVAGADVADQISVRRAARGTRPIEHDRADTPR
jgi:hypothetical protein